IDHPNMKRFNEAYWNEYKAVPGFQAILAYNGAGLLIDAIGRAKSLAGPDIAKALETAKFDGPYGPIAIRKFDHQATLPVYVGQVGEAPANGFGAKWAVNVQFRAPAELAQVPT